MLLLVTAFRPVNFFRTTKALQRNAFCCDENMIMNYGFLRAMDYHVCIWYCNVPIFFFCSFRKCCSKAGAQRLTRRADLLCSEFNVYKIYNDYFREACDWGFVFLFFFSTKFDYCLKKKACFLQLLRKSTSTSPYEESRDEHDWSASSRRH